MTRYYTRACNFYYGKNSQNLINSQKTLPLNGNKFISFDEVEIITRKSKKKKSKLIVLNIYLQVLKKKFLKI